MKSITESYHFSRPETFVINAFRSIVRDLVEQYFKDQRGQYHDPDKNQIQGFSYLLAFIKSCSVFTFTLTKEELNRN